MLLKYTYTTCNGCRVILVGKKNMKKSAEISFWFSDCMIIIGKTYLVHVLSQPPSNRGPSYIVIKPLTLGHTFLIVLPAIFYFVFSFCFIRLRVAQVLETWYLGFFLCLSFIPWDLDGSVKTLHLQPELVATVIL